MAIDGHQPSSYDDVPYLSDPFPETHPDHLGTIAELFGMKPVPIERARVLEIGCSSGNNLIPHALLHPGAEFIGIDSAPAQLTSGRDTITALQLTNISLMDRDLRTVSLDELGKFDYVIAHGFLSWVDANVQEYLWSRLPALLSDHGVAYVSYNTYPGWYGRMTIRSMLRMHGVGDLPPATRVSASREFLTVLRRALSGRDDLTAQGLAEQIGQVLALPDWYLFHDVLEEENHPLFLREVLERASMHGLQYLGDALLPKMAPFELPPAVQHFVRQQSDELAEIEQYLDLFRCEYFRRSLFCRAQVELSRERWFERIPEFALRARPPEGDVDGFDDDTDPVVRAALRRIHDEWPKPVPVREILATLEPLGLPGTFTDQLRIVVELGFRGAMNGTLSLHRWLPPIAPTVTSHPCVTKLARREAEQSSQVTSLFHVPLTVDELLKEMIPALNGSASLEELCGRFELTEDELFAALTVLRENGVLVDTAGVSESALR